VLLPFVPVIVTCRMPEVGHSDFLGYFFIFASLTYLTAKQWGHPGRNEWLSSKKGAKGGYVSQVHVGHLVPYTWEEGSDVGGAKRETARVGFRCCSRDLESMSRAPSRSWVT
jgi:hypothetical protein